MLIASLNIEPSQQNAHFNAAIVLKDVSARLDGKELQELRNKLATIDQDAEPGKQAVALGPKTLEIIKEI